MYSLLPSFILGFHGCDKSLAEAVFSGRKRLRPSTNDYDWLGEGVYFWENSPARALEYARQLKRHPRRGGARIRQPAVIGAVIDPGYCLNLLDAKSLQVVQDGYASLVEYISEVGSDMPANRAARGKGDILLRDLDCAVINTVHATRSREGLRPFDSVRAAFIEGKELYPGSTFRDRNHIQICVRAKRCIKGYFRPLRDPDPPTSL